MGPLHFSSQLKNDFLLLPGVFIDCYMKQANGEYVKVYLYLLRTITSGRELSLETMAEELEHTQRDIYRALLYWDKEQLIRLAFNAKREITDITLLSPDASNQPETQQPLFREKQEKVEREEPVKEPAGKVEIIEEIQEQDFVQPEPSSQLQESLDPIEEESDDFAVEIKEVTQQPTPPIEYQPAPRPTSIIPKKQQSVASIEDLAQNATFGELCFLAQTYMKKTLSPRDTERIGYWYILYNCSYEIIEYLIEYCIEMGHPNINYMEKVILSWHEKGLRNVDDIREYSRKYNNITYKIMRAFGITDRSPTPHESQLIQKWSQSYGFDIEMIEAACERTMSAIQKPSFAYADSILTAWEKNNVRTKEDLVSYDATHQKNRQKETPKPDSNNRPANNRPTSNKPSNNKFHNFEQRSTDYNKLVADYFGYSESQ